MLIKTTVVQARVGRPLNLSEKIHIFKQRPDLVCFPEYWLMDKTISDHQRGALAHAEQIAYLNRLSEELRTVLIGGTTVEPSATELHNCAPIIREGRLLGRYYKRHLMPGEVAAGLQPGSGPTVIELDHLRVAILICSDVFTPSLYEELSDREVDLVFVPTASPRREGDRPAEKKRRDKEYFVEGARQAGAYVVKACGVGELFGKPLQGRSLIAAPWGMLQVVRPAEEDTVRIMTETLDIAELREFRNKRRKGVKPGS